MEGARDWFTNISSCVHIQRNVVFVLRKESHCVTEAVPEHCCLNFPTAGMTDMYHYASAVF